MQDGLSVAIPINYSITICMGIATLNPSYKFIFL